MQRKAAIKEDYNLICRLIECYLSPRERRILEMKEFEEKEIDEIAEILNMQPAAVRMNLSRARKEIREIYFKINR